MHLIYIDDSRDEKRCVFSAISVPSAEWQRVFREIKAFRSALRQSHGIPMHRELHAWEFVSGRGNISDRVVTKWERNQIFRAFLALLASLPLEILNASFPAKEDERAFEWLLNRINRNMQGKNAQAVLICDQGKEDAYTRLRRRMGVHNPIRSRFGTWQETGAPTRNIPIDRVIEDPFFKDSQQSYLIQAADFCAYALLRKEIPLPARTKYGLESAFDLLDPVLVKRASGRDPQGIIRPD